MYKPVIPWIGGKRRLVKHLLPLLPEHTCYCEPFAGAAAMLFYKGISKAEVLNDLNSDLVNLYRVIQHHLEEFCRQFKWALVSREIYAWLQETPPYILTDIQRAARFYYLQRLGFGGKVERRSFGTSVASPPKLNLLRIEEDLSQAHLRLSRVTIEHLSWQVCVAKYDRPETCFFLDPPYWQTEGYGLAFSLDQYEQLGAAMRNMKGKAILTINDHPDMRRIFDGFDMRQVGINYTVGGSGKGAKRQELIITNWTP